MDIKMMVEDFISKNRDEAKAEFDRGLISSQYEIVGIKTPVIEKFAKALAKLNVDIKQLPLDNHEEIMLAGMVIGFKKEEPKKKIEEIEYLLPYIDNWATCDMILPRLKGLESEQEFFEGLLQAKDPFTIRFGIIWIMKYALKNDLRNVVVKLRDVKNTNYYVQLALSWCYTEGLLYDFDFMLDFIQTVPRTVVRNRALQKACESLRITPEQKVRIRKVRSKLLNMEI